MKTHELIIAMITCSLIACSDSATCAKPPQTVENSQPTYSTDTSKITKEYIPTGYYLLADNLDGIKMRKEQSNEVYSIAKKPFISVDNILHCRLQVDTLAEGIDGIISMEFDEQGTQNFKDITGNPLYPNIAIVIANRLLYVVEVQAKVTTGKANILLSGYSKKEMQTMVDEINKGR